MNPNRVTAEIDGEFVVFLIGMRINQPWNVRAWLPVFLAMPRMIRELQQHPELGLLGLQFHGLTTVQYWRSVEQLNAYAARCENARHPPQAAGERPGGWRACQIQWGEENSSRPTTLAKTACVTLHK